jgi:hypothetical protein
LSATISLYTTAPLSSSVMQWSDLQFTARTISQLLQHVCLN